GQLCFFLKEGKNVGQHACWRGIAHARRNLPVRRHARIRDINLHDSRCDARGLERFNLLNAVERPPDEILCLERDAVARPVLDLVPKLLELGAELNLLAEAELALFAGVDDAVLENRLSAVSSG